MLQKSASLSECTITRDSDLSWVGVGVRTKRKSWDIRKNRKYKGKKMLKDVDEVFRR